MGLRNWLYATTGINLKKINLPDNFIEIASKKRSLDNAGEIEVLAIGSSHGAHSFNSSIIDKSFNLCTTSQDLYYSNQLYDYVINKQNKIKTVIVYFSVFSNGYDVSKTSSKDICAFFKKVFNINYQNENREIEQIYKKYKRINIKSLDLKESINGFIEASTFIKDGDIKSRASKHLREAGRKPEQLKHLVSLIRKCKKNSHDLLIIIPPSRADYKIHIEPNIFNNIKEIAKKYNLKIIDLFASEIFDYDDFGDSDHTNIKGAIKLTEVIRNKIF
ncbi:hypothetical protein RHO15_08905 [Utexia brackfieldae]|uniref:hypothetical protein n=1 Tax=Utexia brackfieldae TaxID=3074108 RepID=UPI00370D644A